MPSRGSHLATLVAAILLGVGCASASALVGARDAGNNFAKDQKEEGKKEKEKEKEAEPEGEGGERGQERNTRKVLSRILRNFKNGFEGLSPSFLRELVEEEKFYDYPRFEDGVTDFLRSAGEMRLFTREVNVQVKEDTAVMIIEAEMSYASREDPSRREQRRSRVTFDFRRTDDGWKITEINPRPFFLP